MKKFLFLSLLGLSVLFLWGCSLINNDGWINTWDLEKISQLEQQLSGLLEQFSWLQAENKSLKETLSWSLVSIQTLQSENETLQADVDKYKKLIIEDKLSSKNENTNITTNTTSTTNTSIEKNSGYIKEVYTSWGKRYLKIDYVEFWAMWPSWAPEIINNNPLIRTFEIDSSATFVILKYNSDWWADPENVLRNEFQTWGNGDFSTVNTDIYNPTYMWAGKISLVEIEHDAQKIYKVTEEYRP